MDVIIVTNFRALAVKAHQSYSRVVSVWTSDIMCKRGRGTKDPPKVFKDPPKVFKDPPKGFRDPPNVFKAAPTVLADAPMVDKDPSNVFPERENWFIIKRILF